jgi:peptidyl-Lys metalloendopeptidase
MNSESTVRDTEGTELEAILEIREEVARGEAVSVQFTLHNRTDADLSVLDWYTPLEGLAGEIFRVERDGEPVPYTGLMAKRGVPQLDEYVPIKTGESVSAEVDLTTDYDFSVPGNYTINYLSPAVSQVVSREAPMAKRQRDLGPVQIPSRSVTVRITGSGETGDQPSSSPSSPAESAAKEEAKQISYDNCSASQESTVKSADLSANAKSAFVYAYLNGLPVDKRQTDQLYKTWFGAYTATRYAKVLSNWKKVMDAFSKDITYNCKGPNCKSSWYAYVYPAGKLEVFLCPQFWNAPDSGTDTKYGTLIHEVTHEVAGTKDHAYGQTSCKNLAQNDPGKAIANGDNYEYFAEHYKLKVGSAHLKLTLLSIGGALLAEGMRRYRKSRSSEA